MNHSISAVHHIGLDARFFRSDTGGIGRYTRELIRNLAQLDQHNRYTVFLTEADVPEWDIAQPNFEIRVVKAEHYSFQEQTSFLLDLYRVKPDLMHFLNFNHPLLFQGKFMVTLHDLTMYLFPVGRSQNSKIRRFGLVTVLKRALKAANRVIAISENSAKDAEKYFGVSQAKIEVIYEGGPELESLPVGSKTRVQEYLHSREPYFLFVSQWRPHKGLLTLIEAFNRFKQKTKLPHQLVLTGKQKVSEREVKEALASSYYTDDILTPGFAPEEILPGLYHHATAHILPSEYEGFGLTPLEAFSYGTPVIAANNSSIPEVVGQAGLLFPTRDAVKLAELMEKVASNSVLVSELIEKGRAQLQKFSWEKMAQQTLDLYLSVLEKKR